jgi:protein-disulfide isomerase
VVKQYVVHPQTATVPALATCAAARQGKFAEMERQIWDKGWPNQRPENLGRETMDAIAKDLKLDLKKFKADIDGDQCKKQLEENKSLLTRLGVRGTPAFYINGRYLAGAQPIDAFKNVIDDELKKANEAIGHGTKLDEYYSSIVAKGKKG